MRAKKAFAHLGLLLAAIILPGVQSARAQTIDTYAGGGAYVNEPALQVAIGPSSAAVAADGTVYFASGNTVDRLDPATATVTRVAGNGTPGFSGDGGPATSASLNRPNGVAVDGSGNLYIADSSNNHIRRVTPGGTISTVAGSNGNGFSGDGGPATSAYLSFPTGVAVDGAGNLYIADSDNNRIRQVMPNGIITTIAGNGIADFSGDGDPATAASLNSPWDVAVDGSGNLYISDQGNNRIRQVNSSGDIATVAGNGTAGFSGDGGPATSASLSVPNGVAIDGAGNLYIADRGNVRVRRVLPDGTIATVAGNGTYGFSGDGGPATSASLSRPYGVAIDGAGNLYIADNSNGRVRRVLPDGTIATVAGSGTYGFSGDGRPATRADLASPIGVAFDGAGNLYIADNNNSRIRRVTPDGIIGTVAGNGTEGFSGDGGPATSASFASPVRVAVDGAGNLYITDQNNYRIRRVTPDGTIGTVAGDGTYGFGGDGGPATGASLANPYGVAVDGVGNLYIADMGNNRIRRVLPNGTISTIAGNGTAGFSGDGGPATSASLDQPGGIAVDGAGNLYIADGNNARIRRVTPGGTIATVAGNGTPGFSGDGGPATSASFTSATGVAVDGAGNLYIADQSDNRIRRVRPGGTISTVAGNGTYGFGGDGGPATSASLAGPYDVAVDGTGNLYITDLNNNRIRRVVGIPGGDTTPPVIQSSVTGTLGTNGWYRSNVTVSWTVTDSESTVSSTTGCGSITITSDTVGQTATCSATSEGGTASNSVTIKRDTTLPNATIATPANGATYPLGSTVLANYACSDARSGIASCAGPVASGTAIDTSTAGSKSFPVTATDNAGNAFTRLRTYTVSGDATPPAITSTVTGTHGANGWYTSNVTLTWQVSDPESTVSSQTGCGARSITTDTKSATQKCTATSAGGTNSVSVTIMRDASPPTAKATATPAANAAGWRKAAVTVAFTGTDSISLIANCTPSVILSTEGAGQSASGQCTNGAGLTSAMATASGINIDLTPPTVTITTPANGGTYARHSVVNASYSCSDAGSGLTSCVGTVNSGAAINTATLGSKNFSVTGKDAAGHTTKTTYTYTVQ